MGIAPFDAHQSNEPQRTETQRTQTDRQEAHWRDRKIVSAMGFLREALDNGQRPAAEVEAEALAAGHAHSTLQAARERLRITSKKRGNAWWWIPPKSWRQKQPTTR